MAQGKDYVMETYYRNCPKSTTVKRKRPPFTPEEDVKIINFVLEQNSILKVQVWRAMEESKIFPGRSSMTLRKRFFNSILPNIEKLPLGESEKENLGKILALARETFNTKE